VSGARGPGVRAEARANLRGLSTQALAPRTTLHRLGALWISGRDRLLAVRPAYVLSALVALQWILVAALAVTVRHNGWIYYMGGDQLWHYTGAYLIAHGQLAPTYVGVGWSTILAPISWIAGPNLVSALPPIILFNMVVLLPLGLVGMYGIGERIAGRLFGYWTALLWIILPFVGIRYVLQGYHQKWTELTLPQLLGLGAMSDYPSMIVLIVGAYLCLRALDRGHWLYAAGAGFAVGYAVAVKPSVSVFLVAPALLFALWRRRALLPFAGGLVPCLAALTVWKVRGQGNLPWRTTLGAERVAIGPHSFTRRYLGGNSWEQLHNNLLQLREFMWSDRVLEFIVIAGIVALLVRSRRVGVFVGAWFVVFLLLKGTYVNSRVEDATFWRLMMPAFPAFVLFVASLPLLIPGVRPRAAAPTQWRVPKRVAIAVSAALVAALSLFPIALVAATKPIRGSGADAFVLNKTLVPTWNAFAARADVSGGAVRLRWRPVDSRAGAMTYTIYRSPSRADVACGPVPHAPDLCELSSQLVGTSRTTTFVDHPGAGAWTYRLGGTANWLDNPTFGDVYVFSGPMRVRVP
jgi:hypothetical protein